MKHIFEPVELPRLRVRNRLVRSATWEGIARPDGGLTGETYAIYDEEDLTRRITAFAGAGDPVEIMDERGLTAAAAAGSRSLIGWLYRGLKSLGDYPSGLLGALAEHPAEAAAALYLHTAAAGAQTAIAAPERE